MKQLFIVLAAFACAFGASFLLDLASVNLFNLGGNPVRYTLVVLFICAILYIGWFLLKATIVGNNKIG